VVAPLRALLGEAAERLIGGLVMDPVLVGVVEVAMDEIGDLVRETVRELLDGEAAVIRDRARARHPVGVQREELEDLLLALEVTLGVGQQLAARLVERLALADAVEQIEDRLVGGLREEHAVRRAQRHAVDARGVERARHADPILAVLVEVHGDGQARPEAAVELGDRERRVGERPEPRGVLAHERQRQAGERVAGQLVLVEILRARGGLRARMAPVRLRQDLAEICVAYMVLDEHRERGRLARDVGDVEAVLLERELAAHDDPQLLPLAFFLRADDPVEAIAIGDGDRVVAELGGAVDHLFGRRGAGEEAEVRARRQLHVPARPRLDGMTEREQLLRRLVGRGERAVVREGHARGGIDAGSVAHGRS